MLAIPEELDNHLTKAVLKMRHSTLAPTQPFNTGNHHPIQLRSFTKD